MLTTADIAAHLERRTYLPGWSFHVYGGRHEGTHLAITTEQPDSQHPLETVTLRIEVPVPPMQTPEQLDDFMVWRLSRIATHEVREFYQDTETGTPVFDPHAPYADRDEP